MTQDEYTSIKKSYENMSNKVFEWEWIIQVQQKLHNQGTITLRVVQFYLQVDGNVKRRCLIKKLSSGMLQFWSGHLELREELKRLLLDVRSPKRQCLLLFSLTVPVSLERL